MVKIVLATVVTVPLSVAGPASVVVLVPPPPPSPPPVHASMQRWSAVHAALSLKQAMVASQQPLPFMHEEHAALSNARPTLPRHELLVRFGTPVGVVSVPSPPLPRSVVAAGDEEHAAIAATSSEAGKSRTLVSRMAHP